MTGERVRRGAAWTLASGVAAIAAVVSYSHIYALGRAYGGSYLAARLLPLSVDLLILVGELMLLHEADARGARFRPGWALVVSGIAATMAANVTFGARFGAVGAVIWGWPAYSFVLVAYGMVAMVKRAVPAPAVTPRQDDRKDDKPAPRRPAAGMTKSARAAAVIHDNPDMTNAALAALAQCDMRTVQRARNGNGRNAT